MGNESEMKLVCHRCGAEFVFSQSEQEFYQQKGFSPPTHCKECRQMRRTQNSLVCAICQQKIEKLSDVYCLACSQTPRIEAEAETRRLQAALDEATARLAACQAESAQSTGELTTRMAGLESEKEQLAAVTASCLKSLEEEKGRIALESEGRLQAAESENRRLTALLEQQTQRAEGLQSNLERASLELDEARRYRARVDSLEPAIAGVQATLDEMKRSQERVDRTVARLASEEADKTRQNPGVFEAVKRILRPGRKSPLSSS